MRIAVFTYRARLLSARRVVFVVGQTFGARAPDEWRSAIAGAPSDKSPTDNSGMTAAVVLNRAFDLAASRVADVLGSAGSACGPAVPLQAFADAPIYHVTFHRFRVAVAVHSVGA